MKLDGLNDSKITLNDLEGILDGGNTEDSKINFSLILYPDYCNGKLDDIIKHPPPQEIHTTQGPPGSINPGGINSQGDLKDFYNFDFDEEKWRQYINKQILMRFERNLISKRIENHDNQAPLQPLPPYGYFPPVQFHYPIGFPIQMGYQQHIQHKTRHK